MIIIRGDGTGRQSSNIIIWGGGGIMLLMDDDDGAGGARVNLNSSAYDDIDVVVTIKE